MPVGHVMPLPQKEPADEKRAGPLLRLRVGLKALDLDQALAGGADPTESAELTLRARQLVDPQKRERLADSIDNVLYLSASNPVTALGTTRMPLSRNRIEENRELLVELASRLRGHGPHALRGLALTAVLVEDARGPVYANGGSAGLGLAVRRTLSALDP
jgi:hypothetical protein